MNTPNARDLSDITPTPVRRPPRAAPVPPHDRARPNRANVLLDIRNLEVRFHTPEGIVHAVNDVSYRVHEGEVVAVVGESGCGKSVRMMTVLGLIPRPPGEIAGGQALFMGRDLLKLSEEEMQAVRGGEVAMIFQDPMTVSAVLTVRADDRMLRHYNMTSEQVSRRGLSSC
jgi:ABC-type dipeptide/oligopeptide/nickel transport system ATPase component